ncbi:universal stress protein [Ktedonospora formicarum]|uniref:Universal stress protein UspA n=1 Tax=Ktedonospora formicarum TaxID=2778364 RepID=A0A8J3MRK1_9CHLR|nr:universal stress protein [Ktedonospora formicarum]GHO42335.1 universal stress protein UspA [Ktedonospora formicarum]
MFKRVLVPLDGSELSECVLPLAAIIARKAGGSLILLRCVRMIDDLASRIAYNNAYALFMYNYDETDSTEEARRYLVHVAHTRVPDDVQVQKYVLTGEPASAILMFAQEQQADLIVASTHGRSGFKKWMLGSVTQKLVRHNSIPVLVVNRECSCTCPETGRSSRVLVGLDGSQWAEASLPAAVSLASLFSDPARGELHLLRIVPALTPSETALYRRAGIVRNFEREATEIAANYLKSLENRLNVELGEAHNLDITWSVIEGSDVARPLLCLADTGKGTSRECAFDLLALATHGRGGFERWMLGSVAERALASAHIPVLIVCPDQRLTR